MFVSSSYRQYAKRDLTEDSLQPEEREKLEALPRNRFSNRKKVPICPKLTGCNLQAFLLFKCVRRLFLQGLTPDREF